MEKGGNFGTERQRVESHFEYVVKRSDVLRCELEHIARELYRPLLAKRPLAEEVQTYSILEKASPRGRLGQAEQRRQAASPALNFLNRLLCLLIYGDRKSADKNLTRESAKLFVGPSSYGRSDAIKLAPRGGMVQGIATHQKYLGKLLVVIGHHRRTRGLLGHG